MSTNVVSIRAVRQMREAEANDREYFSKIKCMDKMELLEEMVRFQQERAHLGELTLSLMVKGRILFKALEENAETHELKLLTHSYRRHLEYELAAFIKKNQ